MCMEVSIFKALFINQQKELCLFTLFSCCLVLNWIMLFKISVLSWYRPIQLQYGIFLYLLEHADIGPFKLNDANLSQKNSIRLYSSIQPTWAANSTVGRAVNSQQEKKTNHVLQFPYSLVQSAIRWTGDAKLPLDVSVVCKRVCLWFRPAQGAWMNEWI